MEKAILAVEWLAERYNYVNLLRDRGGISASTADELRKIYLDQAKQMEKEQINKHINTKNFES